MKPVAASAAPERWRLDAGDAAEAVLNIPPDAGRERRFDIVCAVTVMGDDDLAGAWHEMTVLANGQLQWQRRIASSNPGSSDGLDVHFCRSVPVGEGLRLVVRTRSHGVRRHRLLIEADETD